MGLWDYRNSRTGQSHHPLRIPTGPMLAQPPPATAWVLSGLKDHRSKVSTNAVIRSFSRSAISP